MKPITRKYLVATDFGGTYADAIVFAMRGPVCLGKALQVALRKFSCPSCGHLFGAETAMPGAPLQDDVGRV